MVEPDAPRHLFDEVDLTLEVGAERGRDRDRRVAVATVAELDAERRQRVPHLFGVETGAEHVVHPGRAHADALPFDRHRIHVFTLGCDPRARDLGEQLHRTLGVARDRVGIDATLEARARLTAQLEALRRLRDSHALEVGRLEQDLRRGDVDLGGGPTHDPCDGLRHALGVADEEVVGGELALDAVERDHALAVGRDAHADPTPAELREVERVQRLVAFEQHVVGDVDHVADRPHARLHQPLGHPRG